MTSLPDVTISLTPPVTATEPEAADHTSPPLTRLRLSWILLLLIGYGLLVYSAMTFRFNGNWGEGDTMVVTRAVVSSAEADSLLRARQPYPNGVGYVAIVMFVHDLTGVSVQTLQTYIMPAVAAMNVVILFIVFHALSGSDLMAGLATLFTYLQPDFLWVTWRGSHEKFTWMFMIMGIFLLARSFILWNQTRLTARYVIAFYIVMLALVSSNVFFAASFIIAIVLAFTIGNLVFIYRRWRQHHDNLSVRQQLIRLVYVNLAAFMIFYIFLGYLYPDAISSLNAFMTLIDRLALFLFSAQETATPEAVTTALTAPSNYLRISWISAYVFLGLTLFSWLVLGISALVWLRETWRVLRQPQIEPRQLPMAFHLLLYAAFAVQLAGAIFADQVGTLSANLQVRLFTPLMLMAIPLAALGVYELVRWVGRWHAALLRGVTLLIIGGGVFYFSIAAIWKATNEPMLNNWLIFVTTPEYAAGEWARTYLRDAQVWTGTNDRISALLTFRYFGQPSINNVGFYAYGFRFDGIYYMLTEIELAMRRRLRAPPPFFINEHIVYHNGQTQIFYRRPQSAYQR